MSCLTTAGIGIACKEGIGGIKAIYLGDYATFANSATIDGTSNLVTALATGDVFEFLATEDLTLSSLSSANLNNKSLGHFSFLATIDRMVETTTTQGE